MNPDATKPKVASMAILQCFNSASRSHFGSIWLVKPRGSNPRKWKKVRKNERNERNEMKGMREIRWRNKIDERMK